MGKASSSKKVARAAGTGGGRTSRGNTPVTWYFTLFVVIALGVGVVVFSRQQRQDELAGSGSKVPPTLSDHWHVAYGVYECDRFLDAVTNQDDPKGVHTHGDGVIHVHPQVRSAAGKNAVLARFAEAFGGSVSSTKVTWFDGEKKVTKANGDKCGDAVGEWKFAKNKELYTGDPAKIPFLDREQILLAFVPKDKAIVGEGGLGDVPSLPKLDALEDVAPTTDATALDPSVIDPTASTVVVDPTASTTPASTPAGDPTTTAPGSATTAATTASTTATTTATTTASTTATTAKP